MENNIISVDFKKEEPNLSEFDDEQKERYVMIQLLLIQPNGAPMIMNRIYKGETKIDGNEINKKLKASETKLILLDGQKEKDMVQKLDDILVEEYKYQLINLDTVFNFQ